MGVPRAGTMGLNLISRRDANPLDAESGCGQRAGPIKMGTARRRLVRKSLHERVARHPPRRQIPG
jgi:hypothetical protein